MSVKLPLPPQLILDVLWRCFGCHAINLSLEFVALLFCEHEHPHVDDITMFLDCGSLRQMRHLRPIALPSSLVIDDRPGVLRILSFCL